MTVIFRKRSSSLVYSGLFVKVIITQNPSKCMIIFISIIFFSNWFHWWPRGVNEVWNPSFLGSGKNNSVVALETGWKYLLNQSIYRVKEGSINNNVKTKVINPEWPRKVGSFCEVTYLELNLFANPCSAILGWAT